MADDVNLDWLNLNDEIGSTADDLYSNMGDINVDDSYWSDFWGGLNSILGSNTTKNFLNFGSGIYGLTQANQMKDLAKRAFGQSDPFGAYRPLYGAQLMALMANPSSVTKLPGYQFQFDQGAEAVSRKLASKGYAGSGNMGTALTEFGQNFASDFYDKEANRLATLAGANIAPNFGAALGGYGTGIDIAGQSLASLGYGSVYAGGASQGTPGTTRRPNSAGGEAATYGKLLSSGGNLLSSFGGKTGEVGKGLSTAGNLLSGNYGGALKSGGALATDLATNEALGYVGSGAYADAAVAEQLGSGAAQAAGSEAGSAALGSLGSYLGYLGAAYTLAKPQGKFAGTISGGLSGMQIAGLPGLIIGAAAGYLRNGGFPDANPIKASGFSGVTMDEAWKKQNVARLASNPAASLASKLGVKSDSVLGTVLDPASLFSGHKGSHWRNWDAFNAAFPGTKVVNGNYVLPGQFGGLTVNQQQLDDLAGTWYGAAYAPDGNQQMWQQKFSDVLTQIGYKG